ncbi:hypothetical protein GCM10011371_31650 [Novosphingobium marinum]|uniref:Uncharacterized protein n=1 Tax=Novosphingobium marinum TaxID=1514948 RepID=A0A7Y9XYA4_9SPHN|nr:hypothetical protein [Novosphingobium marinum]NYH96851.1 hypothetical protein [Novosphingobium marinum]GGC41901.1 hypothetical protein GCM10011371_31650 [Novosphingobium marinum]
MIDQVLAVLFVGSALLAGGTIAATVRRYADAIPALRREVASAVAERELRFSTREYSVPSVRARVLRPVFGTAGDVRSVRPARALQLRAAA